MDLTKQTLELILTRMSKPVSPTVQLITIYIPAEKISKFSLQEQLQTIFESLIHPYVRSRNPRNEYFDFLKILADQISSMDDIGQGIAIFIEADFNEHILNTDKPRAFFQSDVIRLPFPPLMEAYIGKEFRIEQLIEILGKMFNAYALTLSLDGYNIYSVSSWNAKRECAVEADVTMEPTSGHGDYRWENRKFTSIHDTIKEAIVDVKKSLKKDKKDFLIVFFTPPFGQEQVEENFHESFANPSDPEIIFIKRHTDASPEIYEYTKNAILEKREKEMMDKLILIQDYQPLYTDIIADIINNVQSHNVAMLFVKRGLRIQKSQLLKNTKIWFTDELSKLHEKQDVIPWLIKMSLETSGIVYVTSHMAMPLILYSRFALKI